MDAIISDCGVATYSYNWWSDRSNDDWNTILADAKRVKYPYRCIMKQFRVVINMRVHTFLGSVDQRRKFDTLQRVAIDQHRYTYKQFTTKHGTNSWFGIIPADIRSVIDFYLRADVRRIRSTRIFIMGLLHSFDDAPSAIKRDGKIKYLMWHKLGELHREAAPACIEFSSNSYVTCYWFENGRQRIHPRYDLITVKDNRVVKCGFPNFTPMVPVAKNEADMAEARVICRRDLGIEIID